MLKRISHINNVGAFQACQARPVGFEKITLIYGQNTYGKSTLGDIFSSLQNNDPSGILTRASIPGTEGGQLVDMGFALEGENENDGKALFRQGVWERALIESHLLRVYDDAFFHEHVFSARKFTRDTKVRFSDFILGSQGVETAKRIEQKKQEKRQLTTRKNALNRDVLSDIEALDEFIATPPPESIQELSSERDVLREDFSTLSRQKREAAVIRNRGVLSVIEFSAHFEGVANQLNQLLQTSIETHHGAAKAQLDSHIQNHLRREEGAERWIQQGLSFNNGNNCSFCGQSYSVDAQQLLTAYQQCFNDEYERHERFVNQGIERHLPMLSATLPTTDDPVLGKNDLVFQLYPELTDDAGYQDLLELYISHKGDFLRLAQAAAAPLAAIYERFQQAFILKKARPHQAIDLIDASELVVIGTSINAVVTTLNGTVEGINHSFHTFKQSINDEDIVRKQQLITAQGKLIAKQILRFEKREACTEYQQASSSISALDIQIPQMETSLSDEQSDYLDIFYNTINRYFTALGSHEFVLERGLNRSGHKPVYFLKVKFRGQDVSEVNLDKVLSESDRRALGLSIFLSSLDAMNDDDLSKTVVVFDDPVTSFDDHRVTQTHMKMIELSDRCEQIILLSHFKEGIAQFLQTHAFGNRQAIKLITITKDDNSSGLEVGDIDAFLLTRHDECREDIIDFIERRVELLKYPPRVFLEAELGYRFGKQIREHNVSNESLSLRIDGLQASGIITEAASTQLHYWRVALNPEHHVFPGSGTEDQRNTARAFLQFVFHDLAPAS
jgi:wobble nucleotide-excising tRNase